MILVVHVYMAATALCAALIMVPYLSRWAQESGMLDQPGDRHIHTEAVPRIGGVAIFLAFLLSCITFSEMTAPLRGVLVGALIVFVTGLIDDLYGLSPRHKLCGQVGGAILAMAVSQTTIRHLGDLFGLGPIDLPLWLAIPFTIVAVVGVTNAFNLFDGLDGLAGGVALIALGTFFVFARLTENLAVMTLCACLIGAVLGFLKYNFYPARIFMGDAGSLSVGFILAWVAILLTQGGGNSISPVVPLLVLGLPVIDAVWVMLRRMLRRTSPFAPDLGHVHHKFLGLGFQHRYTVMLIYGFSLLLAVVALLCYRVRESLLFLPFLSACVLLYLTLRGLMNHRDKFSFLQRDSARAVRDSVLYARIARYLESLPLLLLANLIVYLVLVAWGVGCRYGVVWQIAGLGLFGVLFFAWRQRYQTKRMILLYLSFLAVTIAVQLNKDCIALWVYSGTNGLLILLACLLLLRLLFRGDSEYQPGGLDLLLLGLTIVLVTMPAQLHGLRGFNTAVVKAAVLYFGARLALMPPTGDKGLAVQDKP